MGADEIGQRPGEESTAADFLAAAFAGDQPAQPFQYVDSPQQYAEDAGGEVDAQMAEAERRLKKAVLYRTVIQGGLFDQGGDATLTVEVEQEFAVFARQRLAELLGVGAAAKPAVPAEQVFTPQQVVVLRTLADAVTANKNISKNLGVPAEKPAPAAPATPTLKRRAVAPPTPQRKQAVAEAPAPKPAARPPMPVRRHDPNVIPAHDSVIQKGASRFKVAWIPVDPEDYGSAAEPVISALQAGQRKQLPNGVTVFMTEDGAGPYKLVEKKITTQARTAKSVPFPNPQAMEGLTAMQAGQADAVARAGNRSLSLAVDIAKQG